MNTYTKKHNPPFSAKIERTYKAMMRKFPAFFAGYLYAAFFLYLLPNLAACNNAKAEGREAYYDSPEYVDQLYADIANEERGGPVDGMHFSTEYVLECYDYAVDGALSVLYDDPDANVYAEIIVDPATYAKCVSGGLFVGTLHLNPDETWGMYEE